MFRKNKKYPVDVVLRHIAWKKEDIQRIDFDGDVIKMGSQRYKLFIKKGCKCVKCGVEGKYFYKEKSNIEYPYHFNLYGVRPDGTEVLITKDHIIPKSKGGKNNLENYQVMCALCNHEKADKIGD